MNVVVIKMKVYYGAWVSVAIDDGCTLRQLSDLLQDALRWDNDHLFEFIMEGKPYASSCRSYQCNDEDCDTEDPSFLGFVEKTKISQLKLRPKQKFTYHFDFGDEHFFEVEVLDIRSIAKGTQPTVLERHGKMPRQY